LTEYPAKECDESDFAADKRSLYYFNSWNGFLKYCPGGLNDAIKKVNLELSSGKNLEMEGG